MEPTTIIAVLAAALVAGGFIGLLANLVRRQEQERLIEEHLKERSALLAKRLALRWWRKERVRELRAALDARKGGKPVPCGIARSAPPASPPSIPVPPPELDREPELRARVSQFVKLLPDESIAALRLMIRGRG